MKINLIDAWAMIVLTVFVCLTDASQAQDADTKTDPPTLAWKLESGDKLAVEFRQQQDLLTRIDARDRRLEAELVLGVDWTVTGVAKNGNVTLEQTIQRIRLLTGSPGAAIKAVVDIDTAGESQPRGISRDALKSAKKLIGITFEVEMAATGKVISITPGDNVAAATDSLPETSALRDLFSVASLKRLVNETSFALPEAEAKSGDAWDEDSKLSITAGDGRGLQFDRVIKSKISELNKSAAKIDLEIQLTQGPTAATNKDAAALTSPLELLSFTGSGKMMFDRSEGIVTSSETTSSMKTRAIYREDQITTTIDSTNRMTVSRKK